ncbi:hypothetical protein BOX15_Mlig020976g1 [Macrostomum lignano]|uniref:Uncharacterized protein n=1 Tax=Macrostomum lignano TaxID=282301 RepID=A0A267G3R5_9PLAT|nr:hypothetical protein BOX15_Mlig020976g1 [Macrostomum lignano]
MSDCWKSAAKLALCVGTGVVAGPVAAAVMSASLNAASMGKNLAEENYLQAGMDGAFCIFDLCTAGVASGACDAVKETVVTTTKQASRTAVAKTTSEVTKQVVSGGAQQVAQQTASATVKQTVTVATKETTKMVTKQSVKEAAVGTTKTIMKTASHKVAIHASSQVLSLSAKTAGQQATVHVTKAVTKEAAVFTAKQATVKITETVSKSTASCVVEAVANGRKVVEGCRRVYEVGKQGQKFIEDLRESSSSSAKQVAEQAASATAKQAVMSVAKEVAMETKLAGQQAPVPITKNAAAVTAKQATVENNAETMPKSASCVIEAVADGKKAVDNCQTAYTVGKHGKNLLRTEGESRNKCAILASDGLNDSYL